MSSDISQHPLSLVTHRHKMSDPSLLDHVIIYGRPIVTEVTAEGADDRTTIAMRYEIASLALFN